MEKVDLSRKAESNRGRRGRYPAALTSRWPERTVTAITTRAKAMPPILLAGNLRRRKEMSLPIQTTG